jgi:hypothetical protein
MTGILPAPIFEELKAEGPRPFVRDGRDGGVNHGW